MNIEQIEKSLVRLRLICLGEEVQKAGINYSSKKESNTKQVFNDQQSAYRRKTNGEK